MAAAKSVRGIQINKERMSIDLCDGRYYGVEPTDFNNIMFFWGQQTYSDRLTVENSLMIFPTWNWMTNRVRAYYERYQLHDAADAAVLYDNSVELYNALTEYGCEADYVRVTHAPHEDCFWSPALYEMIFDFIERRIG